MLCKNCRQKNEDDGKFCIKCGFTLKPSGKKRVEDVLFIPKKESKKTNTSWILVIIAFIVIGLVIIVLVAASSESSSTNNSSVIPTSNDVSNEWQPFSSVEHGFSINFPGYPSTEREPETTLDNGYSYSSTQYSSQDKEGVDYMALSGDYDIPPKDYDNITGLEGMVNYMNKPGEITISDTKLTTIKGYDAITFSFNGIKEKYIGRGMAIIRDDLQYIKSFIFMVGSPTGDIPDYQKFINSLEFK
jgi:hypothetical protein